MRILNSLSVSADLSSEDSFDFPHNNLGSSIAECLPYATELYIGVKKSDRLQLYLDVCSLQVLYLTWFIFHLIQKNTNVLPTSLHQSWQLSPFQ